MIFGMRSQYCQAQSLGFCNPSVTGGRCYEWRTGVKAKKCPGLGARPVRWNHKALGSSGRGRGPRPPTPHFGEAVFSSSLGSSRPMLPTRTARNPGPNKTCSGPPGTEGLRAFSFSRTCRKWWQVCEIVFRFSPYPVLFSSDLLSSPLFRFPPRLQGLLFLSSKEG